MEYSKRCAALPRSGAGVRSNPYQYGPCGPVVQAALVRVKNHRRNEKAQQYRADDGGERPGSGSIEFLHLNANRPVADGTPQCAQQEDLLQGENSQNDPLVSIEKCRGYEVTQQPVDQYGYNPAAGAGNRAGSGLWTPQPFSGPFLHIWAVRSAQPGTKIVSINHTVSLG